MTIIHMPEGAEIDIKVYLVGFSDGVEIEVVVRVGGLPAFTDEVVASLDLKPIVSLFKLNEIGTDWRLMTREEIRNHKHGDDDE